MVAVSNQGCLAIGSAALLGASFSAYQSLSTLYELSKDSNPSGIEKGPSALQRTFSYLLGGKASSQSSKIVRGVAEAGLWAVSAVVFGALASVTLDPKGEVLPNSLAKRFINIEPEFNDGTKDSLPSGRTFREFLSDHLPSVFPPAPQPAEPEPLPDFTNAPLAWAKHYLWDHGIKEYPTFFLGVAGLGAYIKTSNDYTKQIAALTEALNKPQPRAGGDMSRSSSTGSMGVRSVDGLLLDGSSPADSSRPGSGFEVVSGPASLVGSPGDASSASGDSLVHVPRGAGGVDVNAPPAVDS